MQKCLVFMCGKNCEKYVSSALESVIFQTHNDTSILFIDDNSDDKTGEIAKNILNNHFNGKHFFIKNTVNFGKARNASIHLRQFISDFDFIAIVDADDQLTKSTALEEICNQYESGYDVVWTDYMTDTGFIGGNSELNNLISARGQGWKTSHLFTFRSILLENISESYFQDEFGEWITSACDFAIAYPILDQTRRWKYIPSVFYRYTTKNPNSHHNKCKNSHGLSSLSQIKSANKILGKQPLPCKRWLTGESGALNDTLNKNYNESIIKTNNILKILGTQIAWDIAMAIKISNRFEKIINLHANYGCQLDTNSMQHISELFNKLGRNCKVMTIGASKISSEISCIAEITGTQIVHAFHERNIASGASEKLSFLDIKHDTFFVESISVGFEKIDATYPDIRSIDDFFDLIIIGDDFLRNGINSIAMSLPFLIEKFKDGRAFFVFWGPSYKNKFQELINFWKGIAPDFIFEANYMNGNAIFVSSNQNT